MAREGYASQRAWRGTKLTAACFLDGQFDTFYNQKFWIDAKTLECSVFMQRTICNRYLGRRCFLPQLNEGMARDSIVFTEWKVPNGRLSNDVKNWKIVSCASKKSACGAEPDMLPEAPQKEYCRQINSSYGHQCKFVSLPNKSHLDCGLQGVAEQECGDWFDTLPDDNR